MGKNLILVIGFSFFGLLIGLITGISSAEVTVPLIGTLFSVIGGKLFLECLKKDIVYQVKVGIILTGFSIFCSGGIISGIYIKANRLLTQKQLKTEVIPIPALDTRSKENSYLLNDEINYVEERYRKGELTCDSAIKLLLKPSR